MKLRCNLSIINLDNYDNISLRKSLTGDDFVIEAKKCMAGGGIFGGTVTTRTELARFHKFDDGEKALNSILEAWVKNEASFDLNEWLENN